MRRGIDSFAECRNAHLNAAESEIEIDAELLRNLVRSVHIAGACRTNGEIPFHCLGVAAEHDRAPIRFDAFVPPSAPFVNQSDLEPRVGVRRIEIDRALHHRQRFIVVLTSSHAQRHRQKAVENDELFAIVSDVARKVIHELAHRVGGELRRPVGEWRFIERPLFRCRDQRVRGIDHDGRLIMKCGEDLRGEMRAPIGIAFTVTEREPCCSDRVMGRRFVRDRLDQIPRFVAVAGANERDRSLRQRVEIDLHGNAGGGTLFFVACSNAYASLISVGSLQAMPVNVMPSGAGFASNFSGNAGVGAFGTAPNGTITLG